MCRMNGKIRRKFVKTVMTGIEPECSALMYGSRSDSTERASIYTEKSYIKECDEALKLNECISNDFFVRTYVPWIRNMHCKTHDKSYGHKQY